MDGSIQAEVHFINLDGEEVVVTAVGKGSVEAVFNAVDQFFQQEISLERYHIDAITDGIDAQARVLVAVENKETETIFNASGIDFDVLKASAIAYIHANIMVQKENMGQLAYKLSEKELPQAEEKA